MAVIKLATTKRFLVVHLKINCILYLYCCSTQLATVCQDVVLKSKYSGSNSKAIIIGYLHRPAEPVRSVRPWPDQLFGKIIKFCEVTRFFV